MNLLRELPHSTLKENLIQLYLLILITSATKYFLRVVQKCIKRFFLSLDGIENLLSEIIVLDFQYFA